MFRLFAIITTLVVFSSELFACPRIRPRLVDYNCDQAYKVAVIGDSIVEGVDGDRENRYTDGDGGYVSRLSNQTGLNFTNIGVKGTTTDELLRGFRRNIDKRLTTRLLQQADIILIDVGRNDFWNSPLEPETLPAIRNIQRIIKFLKKTYQERDSHIVPYFIVATLIPTTRTNIRPHDLQLYVEELNSNLRRFKSRGLPVDIYFDQEFDSSILGADGLHPNLAGYQRIADFLEIEFKDRINEILKLKRKDRDKDGIYDIFESWFGMNPRNPDTNSDGILDGKEVFQKN